MFEELIAQRCMEFAERGRNFSEELLQGNLEIIDRYQDSHSYFSIVLAIALTWTKHAKYDFCFFDYAVPFFESENDINLEIVCHFDWRFGEEALVNAMNGLRVFKNEIRNITPDFTNCDSKAIIKCQDRSLHVLESLKNTGRITGVGPWLFLGPFKIIIGSERRFWDDPNIDSVLLPSGIEVNRGIMKLINDGSVLVKDFDPKWIVNEEKSLLEGIGNDRIVQNALQKIADTANTRVLHINSAFYLYGRE